MRSAIKGLLGLWSLCALSTPACQWSSDSSSGLTVCRVVSEYSMPYWRRLLQADILPQKLSRRSSMGIRDGVACVSCMSTGTLCTVAA